MKAVGLLLKALTYFLILLPFSYAVARTTISLGLAGFNSSSGIKDRLGYELSVEKRLYEIEFIEVYSGIRGTYISAQLKNRFQINSPHDLYYFGIPVGIHGLYKGRMVEPFISLETQFDYKVFDHKENKPDLFCDINGDCTSNSPYIQSEKYEQFILRASPKIGLSLNFGKNKISVYTGYRFDLSAFSHRGLSETRTSSFQVGTGISF